MSRPPLLAALFAGALLAACASLPPPPAAGGSGDLAREEAPDFLPIPVDGVTRARLTDSWGDGRDGGRRHQGIDIFAPRSTPVRSTTDGVVVDKALRGLGGRFVSVLGPGGFRHYYAHLEDWGPQRIGDRVAAGEVIGYVGNSGNAAVSPTHLHYGIYNPAGEAIDPYPLLRGEPFYPAAVTAGGAARPPSPPRRRG
jgi:murein DD-endopeptidase MepM/ murein hydrolase activator NlpD